MKKIYLILTLFLMACQSSIDDQKIISERKNPTSLTTIGASEPLYILPMTTPFASRVDTGAQTSSIDAKNIKAFERDGKPWVSFTIANKDTQEQKTFEKEIARKTTITRTGADEKRFVVILDVKFMGKIFQKEFNLNNRKEFEFQGLIGRNILQGNFVVDVSKSNTSY